MSLGLGFADGLIGNPTTPGESVEHFAAAPSEARHLG